MVKSPAGDTVIDILSVNFRVVGGKTEIFVPVPRHHLQPYEVGLDRAAGSGYLPENDMSGIVGVMPGHGDTERPVTARIPIAATLGGRTYLYRGRTRSSETRGHDIIHADTESPDSSPDKITRQCIDIP